MNQISEALRASIAREEDKLAKRVSIALLHLPRVLGEMNGGVVSKTSRQEVLDQLMRDGMLGARHNARRIAHAKKYGLSLNARDAQLANEILNQALAIAQANGDIILYENDRRKFEIRLTKPYTEDVATAALIEVLDVDEVYPVRENVPHHRAREWDLDNAHE